MLSLNTLYRGIVQHYFGTDTPIGLVVLPEFGYLYVTLRSMGQTHIDKLSLHGRGPQYHVIEESLGSKGSFNFAVDHDMQTVFWSDMGRGQIEMMSFDGDTRHTYMSGLSKPGPIAILDEQIFWTRRKSRKLYWDNKMNQTFTQNILVELPPFTNTPDEISLLAITPLRVSDHLCQTHNGGCSHICVSVGSNENSCMCPAGMVFQNNLNKTCIQMIDCEFR